MTASGTEVTADETNAEAENEAGAEAGTKTGAEGAEVSKVDVDGLAEPDVTVQLGLGLLVVEVVRPLPCPVQWPSFHPPTRSVLTGATGPIALVGRNIVSDAV